MQMSEDANRSSRQVEEQPPEPLELLSLDARIWLEVFKIEFRALGNL
jgi:hypothetical protein